jgi:RNA recognition motif-containing protein
LLIELRISIVNSCRFFSPHCQLAFTYCFLSIVIYFNLVSMNIYVSNLSFNVQDEDLKEFFTPYGEVTSAKVINDRETGQSRGFGFVEMADDTAAKKAIAELDQATVDGRAIRVSEARPKENRSGGGGGGGFNRGGGGGGGYNKGGNGGGYNKNRW